MNKLNKMMAAAVSLLAAMVITGCTTPMPQELAGGSPEAWEAISNGAPVRVAVYVGPGARGVGMFRWMQITDQAQELSVRYVDGTEIRNGALKFTEAGHVYRLERNFNKNPLDLTIVDETEGREIQEPQVFLSKLLGNLSVTAFDNTVSIGQLKSSTDAGLVNELKNYIANMNTSGNMSLNITKACDYLKDQRRAFERQIVQDAAKNYAANMAEIRKIEEVLSSPDYVNRIPELTESKEAAAAALETLQKEKEKLLQKAAADQQTLRGKRFEGREDITAFRSSCSTGLKEYEEAEKLASSRGTRNGAVFAVILALAAAGAGFWFTGNTPEGFAALPLNVICWIAAGILAVISVLCFHTDSARKQKAKAASDRFLGTVREHFPELLPPAGAQGTENLENCQSSMEKVEKETDALLVICDSTDQGGKMLLPGAPQDQVAAGDGRRRQVGPRLDPIRQDGVGRAVAPPPAPDADAGAPLPPQVEARPVQKGHEIVDLRLPGRVHQNGVLLRPAGRHKEVLRSAHAGIFEGDLRAPGPSQAADAPRRFVHLHAHGPQPLQVQVHGPVADVAAPGVGRLRRPKAAQEGAQQKHGGTDGPGQPLRQFRRPGAARVDEQGVPVPLRPAAQGLEQAHHVLHVREPRTVGDPDRLRDQHRPRQNG